MGSTFSTPVGGGKTIGTYLIDGKWKILDEIASGAFGVVYRAENVNNRTELAAVKMEEVHRSGPQTLVTEYEFYKTMDNRFDGFPHMFYYCGNGIISTHRALVMTLLGPSLGALCRARDNRFSTSTVLKLALQGLERIETMHQQGYVHQDIKPENIMIGRSDPDTIYFVDFGLCRKLDPEKDVKFEFGGGGFAGTGKYASINVHHGVRAMRRDDLESFGYSLIEFATGKLPWSHGTIDDKLEASNSELCESALDVMEEYFSYVKSLAFLEEPDYCYLKGLFIEGMAKWGVTDDHTFDWIPKKKETRRY